MLAEWTNTIVQGVLLGGLYALFATGLSLVFGIMRMVNIAHGDFIVLAAYVALVAGYALGLGPFAALVAVVPTMALLGYVLQRGVINRTLGSDMLAPLQLTFGLSILLQNGLLEIFSADSKRLHAGTIEVASVPLAKGVAVGAYPSIIFLVAVCVLAGLQLFFTRTSLGRAFRATSDDETIAALMGVEGRHIYGLAMALALAVAAVAGVMIAVRTSFAPSDGPARLLYAFEAVIIGGMGSLWGTLAGGIVLGVAQSIGSELDTGWGILAGHLAFLGILVFRPNGLFPKTRDR